MTRGQSEALEAIVMALVETVTELIVATPVMSSEHREQLHCLGRTLDQLWVEFEGALHEGGADAG